MQWIVMKRTQSNSTQIESKGCRFESLKASSHKLPPVESNGKGNE